MLKSSSKAEVNNADSEKYSEHAHGYFQARVMEMDADFAIDAKDTDLEGSVN